MKAPRQNHGFIYIVSNPAMPGLNKVGLTTNPIETRLQQLNSSTSVPSPFKLERLFELETRFLPAVERIAHKKLRERGSHSGKEFFRVDLQTCTIVVQDVIYELTGSTLRDLVGEAQERAALAAAREEAARRESAEREKELSQLNESVRRQREEWVHSVRLRRNPPPKYPTLQKLLDLGAILIGIPLSLLLIAAIFAIAGPLGIVVGALIVWWIVSLDSKSDRENEAELERKALEQFPPKTLTHVTGNRPIHQSFSTGGSSGSSVKRGSCADADMSGASRQYRGDSLLRPRSRVQGCERNQSNSRWSSPSETACPYCSQRLRLPAGVRGRAICVNCRQRFYVNNTFTAGLKKGGIPQETSKTGDPLRRMPCGCCGQTLRIPHNRRGLATCPKCDMKTLFSATEW